MPSLLLYGVLALAILGVLSGIGYKVRQSGYQAAQLECQQASAKQREAEAQQASQSATGLEVKREKAKVIYRTITQEVDRVVEKPIYHECGIPADGVRLANAALTRQSPAAAESADPVSAANATLRRSGGDSAQENH